MSRVNWICVWGAAGRILLPGYLFSPVSCLYAKLTNCLLASASNCFFESSRKLFLCLQNGSFMCNYSKQQIYCNHTLMCPNMLMDFILRGVASHVMCTEGNKQLNISFKNVLLNNGNNNIRNANSCAPTCAVSAYILYILYNYTQLWAVSGLSDCYRSLKSLFSSQQVFLSSHILFIRTPVKVIVRTGTS